MAGGERDGKKKGRRKRKSKSRSRSRPKSVIIDNAPVALQLPTPPPDTTTTQPSTSTSTSTQPSSTSTTTTTTTSTQPPSSTTTTTSTPPSSSTTTTTTQPPSSTTSTQPTPPTPQQHKRITIHPDDVEAEDIANSIEAKPALAAALAAASADHAALTVHAASSGGGLPPLAAVDDLIARYEALVAVQPYNHVALNNLAAALGTKADVVDAILHTGRGDTVAAGSADIPACLSRGLQVISSALVEADAASGATSTRSLDAVEIELAINYGMLKFLQAKRLESSLSALRELEAASAALEPTLSREPHSFGAHFAYGKVLLSRASRMEIGPAKVGAIGLALQYFQGIVSLTPLHLGFVKAWIDVAVKLKSLVGKGKSANASLSALLDEIEVVLSRFMFCNHERVFWILAKFYQTRAVIASNSDEQSVWATRKEEYRIVGTVLPKFLGSARFIGFLHKRGGVRKNLKKRLFVLIIPTSSTPITHISLSYYDPEHSLSKPKGVIPMDQVTGVEHVSDPKLEAKLDVPNGSIFHLSTVSRVYVLASSSPQVAAEWIAMLTAVVEQNMDAYTPPTVSTAETPSLFRIILPDPSSASTQAGSPGPSTGLSSI